MKQSKKLTLRNVVIGSIDAEVDEIIVDTIDAEVDEIIVDTIIDKVLTGRFQGTLECSCGKDLKIQQMIQYEESYKELKEHIINCLLKA